MDKKLHVAVIFGGRSGEHEVSLESARFVLSMLDSSKYDVTQIGITHEGTWLTGENAIDQLAKSDREGLIPCAILPDPANTGLYSIREGTFTLLSQLDVVFPVMHGTYGEDGTLQGLLEMADLAYVGGGVTGSSVGMDKAVFKDVMRANDIPTVASILLLRSEIERDMEKAIYRAESLAGFPLFVKPANLGSSVGITRCTSHSDLGEGLMEAAAYDRRILVERGVDAREIEVAVLGNDDPQSSVPGEVLPSREFYSYESKYVDGTSGLVIPAPLSTEISDKIRALAVKAYKAIDCSGMARVDFFIDRQSGDIFLNELNTIPGFTSISMYPKLWEASGLPPAQLVDRLIDLAMERKSQRDHTERKFRRSA